MKLHLLKVTQFGQPYSFNHIPPLICFNAQVKSVKHTSLVNFGNSHDLFVK